VRYDVDDMRIFPPLIRHDSHAMRAAIFAMLSAIRAIQRHTLIYHTRGGEQLSQVIAAARRMSRVLNIDRARGSGAKRLYARRCRAWQCWQRLCRRRAAFCVYAAKSRLSSLLLRHTSLISMFYATFHHAAAIVDVDAIRSIYACLCRHISSRFYALRRFILRLPFRQPDAADYCRHAALPLAAFSRRCLLLFTPRLFSLLILISSRLRCFAFAAIRHGGVAIDMMLLMPYAADFHDDDMLDIDADDAMRVVLRAIRACC